MDFKLAFIGLAFLFLSAFASAGTYIGFGNSDFSFEIYRGNTWEYAAMPYTYAYQDNYYFDYPYRVYDASQYYYFDRGWYNYDSYWQFAPDNTAYYTYHGPDYYVYDSYWQFAPDWIGTYGNAYYGSYYYPPSTYYSQYYYPSYNSIYDTYAYRYGTPYAYPLYPGSQTLTGQDYQPKVVSDCLDIIVDALGISVSAGNTKDVSFTIRNTSKRDFDVANVSVYVESFDADAKNIKFPKTVKSKNSGTIEFDVQTALGAKTQNGNATINVSGTFKDGTYCAPSDLQEGFSVSISEKITSNNYVPNQNLYGSGAYYNVQGSTSYMRAKETQQQWETVDNGAGTIYNSSNDGYTYTGSGNGNYNSNGYNYGNANNYNPNSYDNGNEDNYYITDSYSNPDTTTTYYGQAQLLESSCAGLSLGTQNLAVKEGDSSTAYFTFRNYGKEDFVIDSIKAFEYSPAFSIEATRDSARVYSGQNGAIKVKALGNSVDETDSGTAYLKVNGHFASGHTCEVLSDNFYVRVDQSETALLSAVTLSVSPTQETGATSGFLEFTIDNPSNEAVEVTLNSNNVSVSPKNFVFGAKTSGERTFAYNGFDSGTANIYYSVSIGGSKTMEKYTKVIKVSAPEASAPIEQPVQQETQPQETSSPNQGFSGLMATGFAILSDNAIIIGALFILAIAIGLVLAARQ